MTRTPRLSPEPVRDTVTAGRSFGDRPRGGAATASVRSRIVDTAFELFYTHGIRAVGVDRVIAEAGVSKPSLYRYFASKEELILEYMQERHVTLMKWLVDGVERGSEDPAQRLLVVFDCLAEFVQDEHFCGCPTTNAVVEVGREHASVLEAADRMQHEAKSYMTGLAKDAEIARPEELADSWLLLADGVIAAAQRGEAETAANTARKMAENLLADFRQR